MIQVFQNICLSTKQSRFRRNPALVCLQDYFLIQSKMICKIYVSATAGSQFFYDSIRRCNNFLHLVPPALLLSFYFFPIFFIQLPVQLDLSDHRPASQTLCKSGAKPMLHGFIISLLVVLVAIGVEYLIGVAPNGTLG